MSLSAEVTKQVAGQSQARERENCSKAKLLTYALRAF
jgi:hypothetical protein